MSATREAQIVFSAIFKVPPQEWDLKTVSGVLRMVLQKFLR